MSDQTSQPFADSNPDVPSPAQIREFNDRGTLWLLEDPNNLRDLIQILEPELAAHLDTERAERINRSFIPADLQKQESDLIFRIPFRDGSNSGVAEVFIYVLLEHQSNPDALMALRLFLYMGHLWDTQRREWEDAGRPPSQLRLCPVVPIVFYTGDDAWNAPVSLGALMNLPSALQRFVPAWETLFLNLRQTPPETLVQFSTAVGHALRVLQAEAAPLAELEQRLQEALVGLEGLSTEQAGQWLRITWYLALLSYHRRGALEYETLHQQIMTQAKASKFRDKRGVDDMVQRMTLTAAQEAEARGEVRGEVRGEARGAEKALRGAVETLLEARFGELAPEIKNALVTANTETLNIWLRLAARADTLDEIGILPAPSRS